MQGELFTAQIHSFPISRQAALVRKVAARLIALEHDDEAADKYWMETCLSLQTDQQAQGLSPDDVRIQLDQFAVAIHQEISRVEFKQEHA